MSKAPIPVEIDFAPWLRGIERAKRDLRTPRILPSAHPEPVEGHREQAHWDTEAAALTVRRYRIPPSPVRPEERLSESEGASRRINLPLIALPIALALAVQLIALVWQ